MIDLLVTGYFDLPFDAQLGLCFLREKPRPNPRPLSWPSA